MKRVHSSISTSKNYFRFLVIPFFVLGLFHSCIPDGGPFIPGGPTGNNPGDTDTTGIQDYEILEQTPSLPTTPFNYTNLNLPAHFNNNQIDNQDNTPNNNQVTNNGATLGRVLFYDKNLSANNTISCGSCHKQTEGFSDNAPFSLGFEGGLTGRNSMGLTNAKYYQNGHFFWDERAETLEDQVLMPVQDDVEMGLNLATLVEKIDEISYYDQLFTNAFGSEEITQDKIAIALSQYVRSIVSFQSKFDLGLQAVGGNVNIGNTPFPNFTNSENQGKGLFFSGRTNCSACHGTINFVPNTPENNGLDVVYADNGIGEVSGNPQDNGLFKIGSLRNVALTQPYMHDGRFASLEQVINFYNNGVQAHPNLSQELRQNNGPGGQNGVNPRRLNLNGQERAALVDFLETLTDNNIIADAKFSDPF